MINKTTIEKQWRNNPNKLYHMIQNPKLDKFTKRVRGLSIKTVAYRVRDWDNNNVNFERVDKTTDKRFPEILVFDKRFHDATNEVYYERKTDVVDSYAIFEDQNQAYFNKLMRLHRFSETITIMHANLTKSKTQELTIEVDDSYKIKELNNTVDRKPFKLTGEELIEVFNSIQDTNYYDKLEEHQTNHPDLAIM